MRSPKGKKKSFSPICVPKTGKCSVQAQGFSLHSHPSQVAGLNHPYFPAPWGTFSHCPASLTQRHCCSHRAGRPTRPPGNRSSLWESEATKETCYPHGHIVGTGTHFTCVYICVWTIPNRCSLDSPPPPLCAAPSLKVSG